MQPLGTRTSLQAFLARFTTAPAVVPPPVRVARLVAVGTLALVVAAAYYVARFASNLPHTDEWDFAGVLVGSGPSLAWFVEHHNEHRYPLARTLWYAGVRLTGDFRTPMFLFVALMGAASGLLIDTARRLRGRLSLGDLFLPAALLHWGHAFNLLMGYQVAFGLFVLGVAGVCWAVVARRPHVAGVMALVAVQCGGFGLAAAPFLVLLLIGYVRRRPTILVWPLVVAAYAGWVAATMPASTVVVPGGVVTGTACYLAVGLGPIVAQFPKAVWFVAGGVVAAAGVAAVVSLRALKGHDAKGLFLLLAAFAATAVAVGFGRGEWALGYRFVTTSALGLALTWVFLGRRLGWIGLPLAVALFVGNLKHAVWYGKLCQGQMRQLEADVRSGELPPVFLAGKHGNAFHIMRGAGMPALAALRDGGWVPFVKLPHDPAFTLADARGPLPYTLVCPNGAILSGGPLPGVAFEPPSSPVVGLRLHGEQLCHIVYQKFRLRWTDAAGHSHTADAFPAVMPGEYVVTFPVSGIPSSVRLEPATWSAGLTVVRAEWLIAK